MKFNLQTKPPPIVVKVGAEEFKRLTASVVDSGPRWWSGGPT
jgi:hypothetical protein